MRLDGVGRRYGLRGSWVLRGVGLSLPGRRLVRVQGANGSGKSTLLRLLAGIDAPSAGRITGRPQSAYVPERFPAAMPLTALGYLTRMGTVHGLRRDAAADEAREWLERFGAASYARTPLAELSKGSSQKVAVAQALMARPALLVLDEAWTGLDENARTVLDRSVAERVAEGGTVVFVDHDPARLAGAADVTYRVEHGGVQEVAGFVPPGHAGVPADGPRVRIEAEGPPGAALPSGLPGAPRTERTPDGATVLTASAPYSDALLRSLLAGHWHIRSVAVEEASP
ncbi:ATP-binding cassette domain-containing protein [Streptomyces sp. HNM0575]|uniref:ATP-binding cassette domain-containing protein n=1 Tax=Streptomyces sp. HNM0575 TaxID=2716338 RepID=UPI0019D2FE49|nr:ATP-binding cassette domain-containing protein [Streptomyces sp. HNM0575]